MAYEEATRADATTFWGAPMQVVLPELVSCEIHAYGLIEPAVRALMIEVGGPDTVVYDVGAHLGYYSLLAAALGSRVHAFEPAKETLGVLESNAGQCVTIVPAGLWSERTTLPLMDFGEQHSAINTLLSSKDEAVFEPNATYNVPVIALDDYVADTGAVPTMIKIDVEGAELQVLQGARRTIRAARPLLTMEVGDTEETRTSRDALEFAHQLGYTPYDLTDEGLRPHMLRDTYGYGNVLLLPNGEAQPVLRALG